MLNYFTEAKIRFADKVIEHTPEFDRVARLPWVDWHAHVTHNHGYLRLSTALRTPNGTQTLWPIQAAALMYLYDLGGAFCPIPVGRGKALQDEEPVLLERGWTPIGQVRVGDRIFGSKGRLNNVTGIFPQGRRTVYRVRFLDDTEILCDGEHLWSFYRYRADRDTLETKTLLEWAQETGLTFLSAPCMDGSRKEVEGAWRAGKQSCTCISVDAPDNLFVTRNHILTHNTIVTFLAPRVAHSARPALLIDASLREKTWREFQDLYRHWFGPTTFMRRKDFDQAVFNYQELSRENGQKRLFEYQPDLIVADEVQALKNRGAAVTKCVTEFMYAYYTTRFLALTGTPTTRSPMDFWHIIMWCLREKMPLPRIPAEAELWASAVREAKGVSLNRPDSKLFEWWVSPVEKEQILRETAGELEILERDMRLARAGFGNRFASAPGVVVSRDEDDVDSALRLTRLCWDPGPQAREWLRILISTKKTPNGVELQMPTDIWRMERQLASGFWYYWDPPPPEWWLEARKAWGWYLREALLPEGQFYSTYVNMRIFSPGALANAIVQGRVTDPTACRLYNAWIAVKDQYVYEQIAQWIDDGVLNEAAHWMSDGGIVWTEHRAFGEKLAEITGTGFCSEQGLDARGVLIDDYRGAPVVASVKANHKGRNLQAWNRNLGVTIPPNGALVEQLLGRTHRPGQQEDVVYFDWVHACDGQMAGFRQLLADARYIEQTTTQRQKLNYADKIY